MFDYSIDESEERMDDDGISLSYEVESRNMYKRMYLMVHQNWDKVKKYMKLQNKRIWQRHLCFTETRVYVNGRS